MLKNRFFLAGFVFCCFSFSSFAANLEKVKQRGILEVAVYEKYPPYSYVDKGVAKGIDVEVGKALAKQLGVNASIRVIGADENMEDDLRNNVWKGHYMGGGVADVMLHVPYDLEYAEDIDQVKFMVPYYSESIVVAQDPVATGNARTLAVFANQKVGVEVDTLADFYMLGAMAGRLAENVRHYHSIGEATDAMKKREVNGVVGPRGEIEAGLGDQRSAYTIGAIPTLGLYRGTWDLGMAVKATNTDLAKALEGAMNVLIENGTIKKIFDDYTITYQQPKIAVSQK